MYIILDGDDIGLKIEKSFMDNDEVSLKQINEDIKKIVDILSLYLLKEGFEIVFSGADGIICKGNEVNIKTFSEFVKEKCLSYTFSIGIGNNLKSSFLALRYAKSISKNVTVLYAEDQDKFTIFRF